ncbi:MAG: hypothetical protein A2073_01645 [Deltaproteobacteria bacterium GWC2_42_11]|nr:MAG: hypothetical protein A2073_01645 [Deltaproteobacteria bacterium GWC2_42_11]HBO84041.1 hypothetical protein [Deltaproteobacteria bacterium]
MRFGNLYILFFLIVIPFLRIVYMRGCRHKERTMSLFGMKCVDKGYGNICFLTGIFLLIISMASPLIGKEDVTWGRKKLDVIIIIDASLSMTAKDADNISRLETAKGISDRLIQQIGDARIGLIAFAAKPIVLSPLTTDAFLVKTFIDRVDAGVFWNQGTSLESALDEGSKMLKDSKDRKKALIILTDGGDPDTVSHELLVDIARQGIKIYTIGIGSEKGSQIPLISKDGVFTGYKKDKYGETVIARLNERLLVAIAETTSGRYYREGFSVGSLSIELLSDAEIERTGEKVTVYRNVFQYPLGMAIIFLVLGKLLPFAKVQRVKYHRTAYYLKSGGVYGTYGRK